MIAPARGSMIQCAAARLSHEILNSLTGITGALDVLKDQLPESAEIEEVWTRVRREAERVELCLTELNAFADEPAPVLQMRNLHEVIDDALSRKPPAATTRVQRRYGARIHEVALDDKLFRGALSRLLQNAFDAMPGGGLLTITTTSSPEHVFLAIRDTGAGVAPEDLPSLFEPFHSSKTRGLGLGLAIARRHIEAQGGSIAVAATDDGGTEFTIRIPILSARR